MTSAGTSPSNKPSMPPVAATAATTGPPGRRTGGQGMIQAPKADLGPRKSPPRPGQRPVLFS